MKLIDLIKNEKILEEKCPSEYGEEYCKYERRCRKLSCKECWEQEVTADDVQKSNRKFNARA